MSESQTTEYKESWRDEYLKWICAVRKCALQKGVMSCGECPEMEKCPTLGVITANNPDALKNLKLS